MPSSASASTWSTSSGSRQSLRAHARAARAAVHRRPRRSRPLASLAARFAAKEALAKALGAPADCDWHDAEVVNGASGRPRFELRGTVAARADELGRRRRSTSRSPTTPASPPRWWC